VNTEGKGRGIIEEGGLEGIKELRNLGIRMAGVAASDTGYWMLDTGCWILDWPAQPS
jgi:hypothetical protein